MAEVFVSPTSNAKLKTKQSACKLKHGSPNFQEVFRQRCRERMREKRGQLFSSRRLFKNESQNIQETLTKIVHNEFSYLASKELQEFFNENYIIDQPLNQEEAFELENDILADEEQWILQEYERILKSEEEIISEIIDEELENKVICPMCQRANLNEISEFIVCNTCGLKLPAKLNLHNLKTIIVNAANNHSLNCVEVPSFTIIPDNGISLYMTCAKCSEITLII